MSFTYPAPPGDLQPLPTSTGPSTSSFPTPHNGRVAAVAVTVGLVGVAMFVLIGWLVLRLRRQPLDMSPEFGPPTPMKEVSMQNNANQLSLPPEAQQPLSKSPSIAHKALRTARQRDDGSWDFSDRDPIKPMSETVNRKVHLSPPALKPSRSLQSTQSSIYKDELGARTSTSADGFDLDVPPPAYRQDTGSGYLHQDKEP
ncbi:hypothetical protein BJ138DRAFT_1158055 [Hygrophoropsis aurantiaca]|uniref:Uncharacterized protein n=1 Tax=Hygrophoropsis aurantiaca TaxID=72124 RepID=A0ACB8A499_9AGAM|nr:hypothetical protein BJ138DRAFT_1158055 [Hygrophoropsis aurantiaca]